MMQKIKAYLTSGQFWVGFAAGAVAAVAFPKLAGLVRPVATKIPGNQA